MTVYSCKNCSNLKSRIVTKENLSHIKKDRIYSVLNRDDPDSLGLDFPFNMTVYNRILKDGDCPILYCSERMFNRVLYIHRDNLGLDEVSPNKKAPCLKYK
ncbi:MAG: hypothetical protein WC628_08120 [Candidatus Omnitrophota bacterium]